MPNPRELTARAAALVEELLLITDDLYAVDPLFSDAFDRDELDGLRGLDMGLARRLRGLNDRAMRRDPEEAGHRAYQLEMEAA